MHAAALCIVIIGFWALGALPEHIVGLLFFLLAMVFVIAPPHVVFSGFASGTLWLVLGGLMIAEAVDRTGLGARFAQWLIGRHTLSYRALIAAVVLVCSLMCVVMPATVSRILLLLPIMAALAHRLGLEAGSAGYDGVALAVIMTNAQVGTAFLPGECAEPRARRRCGDALQDDVHLRRVAARSASGHGYPQGDRHHRSHLAALPRRDPTRANRRGAGADERRREAPHGHPASGARAVGDRLHPSAFIPAGSGSRPGLATLMPVTSASCP